MMRKSLQRTMTALVLWCLVCVGLTAQEAQVYPNAGHSGYVYGFAWSTDGELIGASDSSTIKIWDVQSGRLLRNLEGRGGYSLAFSPDNRFIAAAFYTGIDIWDLTTGERSATVQHAYANSSSIVFSPDGRRIASNMPGNVIAIRDVDTGETTRTFSGHTSTVNSIAFSPDGRRLLSGSYDKSIRIWNAENGTLIRSLSGQSTSVYQVMYNPSGRQIFSRMENEIKIFDAESGETVTTFPLKVNRAAYSPEGDQILTSAESKVKILDAQNGTELRSFPLPGNTAPYFDPSGNRCADNVRGRGLVLYNMNTGAEADTLGKFTLPPLAAAAISQRASRFAVGSGEKTIMIWDAGTGRVLRKLTEDGNRNQIRSLEFSPDGQRIIGGLWNAIKIWEIENGRELRNISRESFDVSNVTYSRDGKQFLSSSTLHDRDGTILWDSESGQELRTFRPSHSSSVISPDGRRISTHVYDSDYTVKIKIFDKESGTEIVSINNGGFSLAYSPDSRRLCASYSTKITIYDAASGGEIWSQTGHSANISSLVYSADGKRIVSGSQDATIKLWDAETGGELLTISGHSGNVTWVRFSPSGARIYSASSDGTARVWDSRTGGEIARFLSFSDDAWICLTPDGYYTASQNADDHLNIRVNGTVRRMTEFRSTYNKPDIVAARLKE